MTLRLVVAGAAGRMGRALVRAIAETEGLALVAATERPGHPDLGRDAGALAGLDALGVSLAETAAPGEVLIDFTTPAAALATLERAPCPAAVIGATGFDEEGERQLADAAGRLAIVRSGNFSLGVNLLAALVRQAAAKLGPDWDIEVLEAHHRRKVDAPSGTALLLAEAAAAGRGRPLRDLRAAPRDGLTGPRAEGEIGFAVLRAGGIVGEHEVLFAAENELIRFSHQAQDRALFARGALVAARWAHGRPPGLYSMADVLGL